MFLQQSPFPKRSPALRLALIYLVGSTAWILLSDSLVLALIGNNTVLLDKAQSVKGAAFVLLCSVLLYFALKRHYLGVSQALASTEELLRRYQGLGEALRDGISDHDLLTDVAVVNEQMKYFMQQDSGEIQHFHLRHRQRIHPADIDRVMHNYNEALASGSTLWQSDFRYRLHDGEYHDVINRGYIIRDEEGQPLRIISSIQDVSEIRSMRTAIYYQEVRHQRRLGQSVIQAQEAERNRWATELHDNVCQVLTVVKLYLEQVDKQPDDGALLKKAAEMTSRALNDIRQLSASIRPPEFGNTTVRQAIGDLLASVQRVKDFNVETDFGSLDELRLSEEQKLMIYRVVQEQLSNVIKYAGASLVGIRLATEGGEVLVEVFDNGQGFDPAKISGGIGLKNIRSRLELFSGSLTVDAAPGRGCRLVAQFSIN